MKKIIVAGMMLAGATGVFAQGSLVFNNDQVNNVVTHVYSPDLNSPGTAFVGNSSVPYSSSVRSGDYPTGTTTYTGTLIGGNDVGSGSAGWANGTNYDAALYAAPGDNASPSSLTLVAASLTTFQTTFSATGKGGWVVPLDPLIPGTTFAGSGDTTDPTSATVQMRAWYNNGGLDTTYAEAQQAGLPSGESNVINVDGLGGGTANPPFLLGLQSFSLTTTPEPSTIAFGVMGVCAFLARRKK